ncbi:hypothetical protein DFH09DRAFT_1098536 [Mycena vulgaris]|nr:hypothetical protein DFH09DRAFT_1098536 [Mycena vulgaris]
MVVALDLKAVPILQHVGTTWLLRYAFYSVGASSPSELSCRHEADLPHAQLVHGVTKINGVLASRSTCTEIYACESEKFATLREIVTHGELSSHPFVEWQEEDRQMLEGTSAMNASCARAEHKIAEDEICNELPVIFGLENWDVLKKKRRAALA